MKIIRIERVFQNENKTLSECAIMQGRSILTTFVGIELPWQGNQPNVSCVPPGMYRAFAVKRASNGRYAIWLQDVKNRSQVMIHTANFVRQLRGCLAPGREWKDIDNDGILDVIRSAEVMREIEQHIPLHDECRVEIINRFQLIGNLDPKTEKRV